MRLLVAEDEEDLAKALCTLLKKNHYSTDVVYNGKDAYDYARNVEYDGIIMDVMMPEMDGFEVLRQMRKEHIFTPVLFLTACSETKDIIEGLDLGAEDYLTKPFVFAELLARIRVMTRKHETGNVRIHVGSTWLDRSTFELGTKKEQLRLSNKEYQMMEMLMQNPRQIISTQQFLEHIWGFDTQTELNTVWANISYLRKRLKTIESDLEIRANRGIGYSLEESL